MKSIDEILKKYDGKIESATDIIGDDKPSILFYLLADRFSYLLDDDYESIFSEKSIENRKKFYKFLKLIGPFFLSSKQIIENRKKLENPSSLEEDDEIDLPEDSVIWAPNHRFKDDALSSVLAAKRNAYFLFGSLPQFYNTFDGVLSWMNGSILINRKNKRSREIATEKCKIALKKDIDLIIYPEGVWNKSPNLLTLELFPGVYRIAKETNRKIVPIIHYKREPQLAKRNDNIHTVVDNPIDVNNRSEKECMQYLREVYAYWYYLMMERYGRSTREKELEGYKNSTEAWEDKLRERVKMADRYDYKMETTANYISKTEVELYQAWKDIANIQNITEENIKLVNEARQKVKKMEESNFQRRF